MNVDNLSDPQTFHLALGQKVKIGSMLLDHHHLLLWIIHVTQCGMLFVWVTLFCNV